MRPKPDTQPLPQATCSGRNAVIVAEGYVRIREELEHLKELCRRIEPWAADRACNEHSIASNDVYASCREMQPIIYGPNPKLSDRP